MKIGLRTPYFSGVYYKHFTIKITDLFGISMSVTRLKYTVVLSFGRQAYVRISSLDESRVILHNHGGILGRAPNWSTESNGCRLIAD